MNYRHQFHAGNFADVVKHVLLVQLLRALQRKEKGFVYIDTHAGRGRYDLAAAARGDSLAREPEWPAGIGRLWAAAPPRAEGAATDDRHPALPAAIAEYLALVRQCDRSGGNLEPAPRFYPGSPWLARALARPVDRLALCEKHPAECAALRHEFAGGGSRRLVVHEMDGYLALRALLPPPERRALVLIDPPYEEQDEPARIGEALREAWQRFPHGVYAIWYPLTERARSDEFRGGLVALNPPPTLAAELRIAGEGAALKMKGCGLAVVNPPWQYDREAAAALEFLAGALAQAPGGGARVEWVVAEK